MNAEIDIFGLLVSSILPSGVVAAVITAALSRLFDLIGFYHFVWHRALFDFSIFICALGVTLAAAPMVSS